MKNTAFQVMNVDEHVDELTSRAPHDGPGSIRRAPHDGPGSIRRAPHDGPGSIR